MVYIVLSISTVGVSTALMVFATIASTSTCAPASASEPISRLIAESRAWFNFYLNEGPLSGSAKVWLNVRVWVFAAVERLVAT